MRVRYGFIQWRFPYRPPLRGWPQVLYWCKIMSSVCTEQDELIDNFKRDTGASDVPFLYTTCFEVIDDEKMYKAQDPERVLRQRIKKLETTMRDKFPLFADDMIQDEKEKKKDKFDIDKIAEDQRFRQELAISVLPENYLPSKTEGSDEWKKHDWAKVNERWRGLVIARSRRECREHPVEIFIDKEKRLK